MLEIFNRFNQIAEEQTSLVSNEYKDTKEYIWKNNIFSSSFIRYGHLEYFKASNRVEVVHCVFYPSPFVDIPIYGFDIIALGGNVTGIFCDLTCSEQPNKLLEKLEVLHKKYFHLKRELPGWGSFFSKNFLILDPKEQTNEVVKDCIDLYKDFLSLNLNDVFLLFDKQVTKRIDLHNNYSLNQRKNTKTQKALAHYIGEKEAEDFIINVLFPTYK